MSSEFDSIFVRLRAILQKNAEGFTVADSTPQRYGLEGRVGPATLQAWRGKEKTSHIPVAWVEIGKSYVSYHLMPVGSPKLSAGISAALKARMQGKTCFNFKAADEFLFKELEQLTAQGLAAFVKAGFVATKDKADAGI